MKWPVDWVEVCKFLLVLNFLSRLLFSSFNIVISFLLMWTSSSFSSFFLMFSCWAVGNLLTFFMKISSSGFDPYAIDPSFLCSYLDLFHNLLHHNPTLSHYNLFLTSIAPVNFVSYWVFQSMKTRISFSAHHQQLNLTINRGGRLSHDHIWEPPTESLVLYTQLAWSYWCPILTYGDTGMQVLILWKPVKRIVGVHSAGE